MKEYRFRISEDERLIMIKILRPYLELLKAKRKILLSNMPENLKRYFDENTLVMMEEFEKSKYEALGIDPLEGIDAMISIVSNILNRFEHPGRGRKRLRKQFQNK